MIKIEAIKQEDGVMVNSTIKGQGEDILQELISINAQVLKSYGRPKNETIIAAKDLCSYITNAISSIPDEAWEIAQGSQEAVIICSQEN